MKERKRTTIQLVDNIHMTLHRIVSSEKFFYFVIIFFFLQATWVALSFRYPMIFDERYHFEVIKIFSEHTATPIIYNQPTEYDPYGSLAYGSASLYHYLAGFVLILGRFITTNETVMIISLRIIGILLIIVGLFILRRLFDELSVSKFISHLAIFFYTMIPLVTLTAATISYDSLLFPLAVFFTLQIILLYKKNNIAVVDLVYIVIVGSVASLVKFSFLPVFFLGFLAVLYMTWKKLKQHAKIDRLKNKYIVILTVLLLSIILPWFFLRYVVASVLYGSPIPSCEVVMSEDRCMQSGVYRYEKIAENTISQRTTELPHQYLLSWVKTVLLQLDTTANTNSKGQTEFGESIPIFASYMGFSALIGTGVLIYSWKELKQRKVRIVAVLIALASMGVVLLFNILTYYRLHQDSNVQARYILVTIPIILALSMTSMRNMTKKHKGLQIVIVAFTLLMCTQGGGVAKHILTSRNDWYWNNTTLQQVNTTLRKVLKHTTYGVNNIL